MTNLPSLADRRLYLKLCSLYKIVHNLYYLPSNIVVPKVTRSYTSTPFTLYQPFAHTNCFFNSFVPHSMSHWNSLPEPVVSTPSLATFKHSLKQYIIWTRRELQLGSRAICYSIQGAQQKSERQSEVKLCLAVKLKPVTVKLKPVTYVLGHSRQEFRTFYH